MRIVGFVLVAIVLGGCAYTDVAIDSTRSSGSGASVVSSSAGLQVNASGGAAAVLAAGLIVAGTMSEQDCTRPITGSGNLKCR